MSDSPLFSDIASYSSITSSDRDNYLEELPFESPRSERSELLDDILEKLKQILSETYHRSDVVGKILELEYGKK